LLYRFIEELLAEVVWPSTATFDLNEIGWREDGAEKAEVQDIRTIVTGGHHTDRYTDTGFARLVSGNEIRGTEQGVICKIDGVLRGAINLRRDLHSEVGLILTGEHAIRHLVQDFGELGGVVLTDGEDDGLTYLTANGVAQGVLQKSFAEELVGGFREKAFFKLPLFVDLFLVTAIVILKFHNKTVFGKKLSRHLATGVHHSGADEEAIFHAIKQRVTKSGLSIVTAKGAVGIH
jgi:hypothetical protein